MFLAIFLPLNGKDTITEEEYRVAALQMRELCEKYPNSAAAARCVYAVTSWREKGFVPAEVADSVLAIGERANPAEDELKDLERACKEALRKHDMDRLKTLTEQMRSISKAHPDTVSEYLALANLCPLYRTLGERDKAKEAAQLFLEKYPPDKSAGYPSYTHYRFLNTFGKATGLASASVDAALDYYRDVGNENKDNVVFGVPAMFDAGELALRNKRYDEAREFFDLLASSFDPAVDDRVVLARFKTIDIALAEGDEAEALTTAKKLREEYRGTRWQQFAENWIDHLAEQPALPSGQIAGEGNAEHSVVSSKYKVRTWLIASNVFVVACIGVAAAAVRRKRRKRK
ncbi:MAG: hypothetical protein M3552_15390 [Planctomycetota bacterium]|nr:hypothetical protein [Planctomycetota bacterium]